MSPAWGLIVHLVSCKMSPDFTDYEMFILWNNSQALIFRFNVVSLASLHVVNHLSANFTGLLTLSVIFAVSVIPFCHFYLLS